MKTRFRLISEYEGISMSRISTIGEHIVINLDNQTINYDGKEIYSFRLCKRLYSLLEYFCEHANMTLTKEQLYSRVHDDDDYFEDTSVRNLIYRLRHVISKEKYPEFAAAIVKKPDGYMYTGSKAHESETTTVDNGSGSFSLQEEHQDNNSEVEGNNLSKKVEPSNITRTDHDVIVDNMRKAVNIFAEAFKTCEHGIAEEIRSNDLFYEFKKDSDEILKYCISIDPSAEPISIQIHNEIDQLTSKWSLNVNHVSNAEKRKLIQEVLSTISQYKYYLSDKYLRVLNNGDRLIYRNNSMEEGNRLINELRPKTIELRRKMKELYEQLWPISDSVQSDSNDDNAEQKPSDDTSISENEGTKGSVVHQTIVNQYGDHPVHIDHVDNLNL